MTTEGWLVRSEIPCWNGQSNPIASCAFQNWKHEISLRPISEPLFVVICCISVNFDWISQTFGYRPNLLLWSFGNTPLRWRSTICSVGEIHFAPLQFIWSWDESWNVWQNINISLCIIRGVFEQWQMKPWYFCFQLRSAGKITWWTALLFLAFSQLFSRYWVNQTIATGVNGHHRWSIRGGIFLHSSELFVAFLFTFVSKFVLHIAKYFVSV